MTSTVSISYSGIKKIGVFIGFFIILLQVTPASLQAQIQVSEEPIKAEVTKIIDEGYRFIPGTNIETSYQKIEVEILEGKEKGEKTQVDNESYSLSKGELVFLEAIEESEGEYRYVFDQPDRTIPLLFLSLFFVAVILSFSFWKGIRSILSLVISLAIILFLLLPKLLEGAPPVFTSVLFASLIVASAMYITHGFNRVTHAAFLGTVITLIFTGLLSYLSVTTGKLSGLSSDEALFLNLETGGLLDMSGLLLGAIIIGILGILDDVSITQAATMRELYRVNPQLDIKTAYQRAHSVGREHIVSLINTLVLAYAGASLPLLLLVTQSQQGFLNLINMEIFATEITRTLVGSIGLIMAVPITTVIAAFLLKNKNTDQ
ncbi:MAG: YibE/F family protein [Candidatus Paceibacterota bacterium]